MKKFNQDNRGRGFERSFGGGDRGGRPSFGGGNRGGNRFGGDRGANRGGDRGPVVMNDAVCDECQRPCQVPFRPTGDRPIYCKNCFDKRGGGREAGRMAGAAGNIAPGGFSINDIKTQLAMINIKLDRILKSNSLPTTPKKEEVIAEETVKAEPVEITPKKVLKSKKVSKK